MAIYHPGYPNGKYQMASLLRDAQRAAMGANPSNRRVVTVAIPNCPSGDRRNSSILREGMVQLLTDTGSQRFVPSVMPSSRKRLRPNSPM